MPNEKAKFQIPPFEMEVWCPCCQKDHASTTEDPSCLVDPKAGATLFIEPGEPWELMFYVECVRCECSFQISLEGSGKWTVEDIYRDGCQMAQKK